jgi:hypothetical protein
MRDQTMFYVVNIWFIRTIKFIERIIMGERERERERLDNR